MNKTQGIDYQKLSLCDALDLAVLIEEEARDRYAELADQLTKHHTPEAAGFFRKMATIEEKHRVQLAERRAQAFGHAPVKVTREMLFDIEAPEYDEARAFMSLRHALETALRSEEKAHAFFAAALPQVKEASVRELFTELCDEEVEHQALVRAEMKKLPAGSDHTANDYSDEPVGH